MLTSGICYYNGFINDVFDLSTNDYSTDVCYQLLLMASIYPQAVSCFPHPRATGAL